MIGPSLILSLESDLVSVREETCRKLGLSADPRVVDLLVARLADADRGVCRAAHDGLMQLSAAGAADLAPGLITKLASNDGNVRHTAREALARIRSARATQLICALKEGDPDVRATACLVLGRIGNAEAVEFLVGKLRDKGPGVKVAACQGLARTQDLRAVEPLIRRLADPDPDVRQAACDALGAISDVRSFEALVQMLGDEADDVRASAGTALGRWVDEPLARAIAGALEGSTDAVSDLCGLAAEGDLRMLDPLARYLGNPRSRANDAACEALQAVLKSVGPGLSRALCSDCLSRLHKKIKRFRRFRRIELYTCRLCGQARTATMDVGEVVAVLDSKGNDEPIWKEGSVKANWLKRRSLFDFDRVEIVSATDEDVVRFCVQVGNDTDDYRRKRYKNMPVSISPDCRIEEMTVRILKSMFGEVSRGSKS